MKENRHVKDRFILEGDPHLLIEGMLIAAYAIGAERDSSISRRIPGCRGHPRTGHRASICE
jgi:hypothetical protein